MLGFFQILRVFYQILVQSPSRRSHVANGRKAMQQQYYWRRACPRFALEHFDITNLKALPKFNQCHFFLAIWGVSSSSTQLLSE